MVQIEAKDSKSSTEISKEVINFYVDEGIRSYIIEAAARRASWKKTGERGFEDTLVEMLGAGASSVLKAIAKRWSIPFVDELQPPGELLSVIEDSKLFNKDGFISIYNGEYVPFRTNGNTLDLICSSRRSRDKGINDFIRLRLVNEEHINVTTSLASKALITKAFHLYFSDGSRELNGALRKMEAMLLAGQDFSDYDIAEAVVFLFARAAYSGASDAMIFVTETSALYKLKISGVALLAAETEPVVLAAILRVLVNVFAGENDSSLDESPQETLIDFNDDHMSKSGNIDKRSRLMLERAKGLLGGYRFRLQLAKPQPRTSDGVYAVFRVLKKEASNASLSKLGYGSNTPLLKTAVCRKEGLILFVGTTGSGKTTGADAMVGEVDPIRRWVYTIENPIEFQHPLFMQHEVRGGSEEYLKIIKSFLRSSPDVCFFGETREAEVALRLCELALTGSLVISTLHAPDAVSAIQRMRAWGIDNNSISETLILIVGQRLFPRICVHCSEPISGEFGKKIHELVKNLRDDLKEIVMTSDVVKKANEEGCKHCFYTGYSGQWLVYEMLPVNAELRAKIVAGDAPDQMRRFLHREQDMYIGIARGVGHGILDVESALPELLGA